MSAVTTYASAFDIVLMKFQLLPLFQLTFTPPSLPMIRCCGFFGSIQIACWSTCPGEPLPPASSRVTNVLPPSSDFATGRPATYTAFSLVGSTRIWLKYIGRALQLLTCVHVRP